MKNAYSPGWVSLLGGGQLGKMFIAEAMRYDLKVRVLDPDPNCPCAPYAHEFVCGSFLDEPTVLHFCEPGYPVTIEIEHVNIEALKKLQSKGIKVVPEPEVLALIQDKGFQKEFYQKNQIPTSPFVLIDNPQDYNPPQNAFPFVQKTRKGGYDGKGVLVVKSSAQWPKNALAGPSVIEEMIAIKNELGILVASDGTGGFKVYEPVEMVFNQEANLVDYLVYPSALDQSILDKAKALALHVAQSLPVTGMLAVELFLTESDELLVNEIAPRTHNSGHAGIEASLTSQFEQHVRIMAGLPLGETTMLFPAAMINILGSDGYQGSPAYKNLPELTTLPGVFFHLYGKKEMKPGRKMGHVTLIALEKENIREKVLQIKQLLGPA